MTCYGCGSPEGDDVRLCPACREERAANESPDLQKKILSQYDLTPRFVAKIFLGDAIRVTIVLGALAACALYFFLFSDDGFFSKASRLERACLSEVSAAKDLTASGEPLPIGHPFSTGGGLEVLLREQFGEVGSAMAAAMASGQTSICTDLRTTCRSMGNSDFCTRALSAL